MTIADQHLESSKRPVAMNAASSAFPSVYTENERLKKEARAELDWETKLDKDSDERFE